MTRDVVNFNIILHVLHVLNPFLNKPWFLHIYSISLLKTLLEKEELLVMSNFSFSHSVFYHFVPLSSNLKLSSANSFRMEDSKICRMGKGYQRATFCQVNKQFDTFSPSINLCFSVKFRISRGTSFSLLDS